MAPPAEAAGPPAKPGENESNGHTQVNSQQLLFGKTVTKESRLNAS
jgi:hypothetical protein